MGSVAILGGSLLIVANPDIPFNPLPPPTVPPVLQIPSATTTATASLTPTYTNTVTPSPTATITQTHTPSQTPTATHTPTNTLTPTPTLTLTPTFTPVIGGLPTNPPPPTEDAPANTIIIPTNPPAPPLAQDESAAFPFVAQGTRYQSHSGGEGCSWLSIAGTVTGLLNEQLLDVAIEVSGEGFSEVHFSGSAPQFGQSGFEVYLGNRPASREFALRILDPLGQALTDYILVNTGNSCETNVAVVDFRQVRGY